MSFRALLFVLPLFLVGCNTTQTHTFEVSPVSTDKSTLVIYHTPNDETLNKDGWEVCDGDKSIGETRPNAPVKIEIEPGQHDLHVKSVKMISKKSTMSFEKGGVYYLVVSIERGVLTSTISIEPGKKFTKYATENNFIGRMMGKESFKAVGE